MNGHSTGHRGRLFIEPDELRDATGRLAAEGFQLHFHALGDLAVSTALDVLEALPAGQRQAGRHHLAHLQFIMPRDMNRFQALDAVAKKLPDVILMDLSIPGVDGWEVTRRLKADARTQAVPIIALTAHAMRGDEERARAAGFDGYLMKPIDQPALDAVLARFAPLTPVAVKG